MSDLKPKSVNEFILIGPKAARTENSRYVGENYMTIVCQTHPGTMSLNNNILSITAPSATANEYQRWSGPYDIGFNSTAITLPYTLYYVGNIKNR